MKKIVVGLLTSATVMAISTISFGATGIVNTDNSRLRSKASSDSPALTVVSINDKVEVLEESGDWYKINADGEIGYIRKDLLDVEDTVKKEEKNVTEDNKTEVEEKENTEEENTEKQEQNAEETQNNEIKLNENFVGNVKSEVTLKIIPSINSIDIAKIESNTQITIIEIINDWCHLETSEYSGWARLNIVEAAISETNNTEQTEENTEQEGQEEKQEETTQTETKIGYVNVESVNLREEKNTSSEVLDGITKNTEVTILGEEDGWYKVKVKNLTGYISKKYISDKKVEEVTSRASDTARQIEQEDSQAETEEPESIPTSSTNSGGTDVVSFAKQYLGSRYVSGGASPSTGFDCSGFTSYVYRNFGVSLSRTSSAQAHNGTSVSKSNLQPGDLLIFNNSSNTSVGHVGIYMGNDQFIHAANGSKGVITTSLSSSYYEARYVDARRVL